MDHTEGSRDTLEVETIRYAKGLHLGDERKKIKGNLLSNGLSKQVDGILLKRTKRRTYQHCKKKTGIPDPLT